MASTELYVHMNGHAVGTLTQLSRGTLEFTYFEAWLQSDLRRPISLSLPLSPTSYTGDIVYNFFDNLLPDNLDIRERIQKKYNAKTSQSFDLLSHIGRDCVGALQLCPNPSPVDVRTITADKVCEEEIAHIIRNYGSNPLGMNADDEFRISIAGVQEKTALLKQADGWYRPRQATPTTHIIKLPIGFIQHQNMDLSDSVENEWLCQEIIRAFGVPIAKSSPELFSGEKVLVVERFDRKWAEDHSWIVRIPQEDMCQVFHTAPALKYESDGGPGIEQIMNLLVGSTKSQADRETFLTAQLLFWLLAAIDGHAKNFSIVLEQGGAFQLTPLYDVISAYPLIAKNQLQLQKISLAMALTSRNRHYRWNEIQKRHLLSTAKRCRFSEVTMQAIIDRVCDQLDDVIAKVEQLLPVSFPDSVATPIFDGMRKAKAQL
ncbi:type II toxin-antitoxin system HipA family toxin [Oligoflexia bacterium]|nr:type II toxin-antitoxin system HipA family toxin [Oligoflexia bacterium]